MSITVMQIVVLNEAVQQVPVREIGSGKLLTTAWHCGPAIKCESEVDSAACDPGEVYTPLMFYICIVHVAVLSFFHSTSHHGGGAAALGAASLIGGGI
jgi:hypothetical protein